MTIIYGGSENGLLNSSFALIGRGDQAGAGDPGHGERVYVNSVNGNLVIQHQDAYLPSFGADFQLVRTYNQRGLPVDPEHDGARWSLSTSIFLSQLHDGPEMYYEVQYGDGSTFEYRLDAATGLFISPDGADSFETLQDLNVNGNTAPAFLLTRADQTVLAFNRHGDLLSSVDPNGVRMDYFYQSNRLSSIQDDTGHQINYIYAMGNLVRIEDETGAVLVQYKYQGSKLVEVIDRLGHSTKYHYSPQGELILIELPFEQDVGGQSQSYATREIQLSYDSVNWADSNQSGGATAGTSFVVTQIVDAQGGITTFDYAFNEVDMIAAPGNGNPGQGGGIGGLTLSNQNANVRPNGNPGQGGGPATPGAGRTRFNIMGNPFNGGTTTITDAAGNTLVYEYDGQGQVTRVTDQLGYATEYIYDDEGNLVVLRDRNAWGATHSDAVHYREIRQSLGVIDLAGNGKLAADLTQADLDLLSAAFSTTMTYDDRGNLLTSTDNDGFVTTYIYNAFNKIESITSGVGTALVSSDEQQYQDMRVNLGYAALVANLSAADKTALLALHTTEFDYDANQNLIERRDAGGDITRYEYDANGNRTRQIVFLDANDLANPATQQVTQYFYDGFGNNIETIDGEGVHTFGDYDHFGNLIRFTDGNGGITTYTYDDDNRLLTVTDALSHTTINAYDAVGNRTSITDQNGHTVIRVYSQNNFLLAIIDASDSVPAADRTTAFTYDVVGNRTATTDAEGRETTYIYNERRELVQVVTALVADENGAQVQYATDYSYDAESNRLSINDHRGNLTEMLYTQGGLLEQRTDASGNVTQFRYDANNNQIQIIVGAQLPFNRQQIVAFSYDEENQLVTRTDAEGGVRTFTHDAPGNVVAITDENGNTTSYAYDFNNRLVLETSPVVAEPVTGAPVQHTVERRYDANGNQVEIIDANGNSTQFTYDPDNRLVMVQDGNGIKTVYSYDSRNNRTSIQIGVQTTVAPDGQVTVTDVTNAQVTRFGYDEFNQLTTRTDGVGTALAESDLVLYQLLRQELGYAALVANLTGADQQALRDLYTESYNYDRVGNATAATDNEGRINTNQYDSLNRLISQTDALGQTETFRYDGNGNLVGQTDKLGRDAAYVYDMLDRLTNSTDTRGMVTARTYDEFGNLLSNTRAFGTPDARSTGYEYDLNNRLIAETDPAAHRTVLEYDAVGNRVRVTDAVGNATQFFYDALNRNVRILDPLTFETNFEYDGAGNRVRLIDSRGGIQSFDFDAGNRQIRMTDAEGRVMEFAYDVRGNRVEVRTAVGTANLETTVFEYDAQSNLRSITDAQGGVITNEFDRVYNNTKTVDANGNATFTSFDALNRVVNITDAAGGVTAFGYDAVNNLLTQTDALGRVTSFAYDAGDRLMIQTAADSVETHFAYDEVDNRVTIIRAANTADASTATFVYNLDDKLVAETDGLGNVTSYLYDANHNVTGVTNANGNTVQYGYDANNQLTTITDALGNVVNYSYDGNGNRVQVTDQRGFNAVTYYNGNNEVALAVDAEGFATRFTYDANGNVVSRTLFAQALTLPLTPGVEPVPVVDATGDQTTLFQYDSLNRLTEQTSAEGYRTQFVYDAVGNRMETHVSRDQANTDVAVTRAYFDDLNRAVASRTAEGYLVTRDYDAIGNLVKQTVYDQRVSVPAPGTLPVAQAGDTGRVETFVYDAVDRMLSRTSPLGAVTAFTYDARGNQTSSTSVANVPGLARTTSFVYDQADRLTDRIDAAGTVFHFDLDAVGNVVTQSDAFGLVGQRDTLFTYDASNRLVSQVNAIGVETLFTYDAAGNMVARTDAAGVVGVERTDAFEYNGNNFLSATVNGEGERSTISYDAAGNEILTREAPALAEERITQFIYDRDNRLVEVIDANSVRTQYSYDGAGNRVELAEAVGVTGVERHTTYTYDLDGRLLTELRPEGGLTQVAYDVLGLATSSIDANGNAVTRTYDAEGRLLTVTTAENIRLTNTYDLRGNLLSSTQAYTDGTDARTSTYEYDVLDRRTVVTDGEGYASRFTYDLFDNQTKIEVGLYLLQIGDLNYDAAKAALAFPLIDTFAYDAVNRMTSNTDGNGNVRTFVYDEVGNRVRSIAWSNGTAAEQRITETDFDLANREIEIRGASGSVVRKTYDEVGNLLTRATLQSGGAGPDVWINESYEYDGLGRQTASIDGMGTRDEVQYDAVGNVTEVRRAVGTADVAVFRFEYDLDDRRTANIDGLGNRTVFTYDSAGNRITATDALNNTAHYYFDLNGRQIAILDPLGYVNTFTYDAANNVLETRAYITPYTGLIDDFVPPLPTAALLDRVVASTFDRANNVESLTDTDGTQTLYVHDSTGKLRMQTDFANTTAPRIQTFVYDGGGRLAQFTGVDNTTTSFEYDGANNKITETISSSDVAHPVRRTEFEYDLGNRLVRQIFDPAGLNFVQSIAYDLAGNLISKTDANGGVTETRYDLNNRYTQITDPMNNTIVIGYDRRDNQVSYTDAIGNTVNFEYDKNDRVRKEILPEVLVFEIDSGSVLKRPTKEFIYDAVGNAFQTIDANGNRTTSYYDANRNVVAQVTTVGENNNILREFTYSGSGKVLTETLYMTPLVDSAHTSRPPAPGGDARVITRAYDIRDRLISETYPPVEITTLDLTDPANPIAVTSTVTPVASKTYDAFGNEVENIDVNGNREVFYYDVLGRVIGAVDPLGYLVTVEFDSQGNALSRRNYTTALDINTVSPDAIPVPAGPVLVSSFIYDAAGRNISEITPVVTNYVQGALSTPIVETIRTDNTFDAAGNRLTRTRAAGTSDAATEYSYYDASNQLVALINENRTLHTYMRDANGNVTERKRYINTVSTGVILANLDGRVTNFASLVGSATADQATQNVYDALSRIVSTTDLMGPGSADDLTVLQRYDANNNQTWRQDENFTVTQRGYDGQNRSIRSISPDGSGSSVRYDAMGNDVRLFTGDVANTIGDANINNVSLDFVGDVFSINWNTPATPAVNSWVVWDVNNSHGVPGDYTNQSSVQGTAASVGNSASYALPIATLTPDDVIYFRIVSRDLANNLAWTSEQRVLVPPKFTSLEVESQSADSLTVRVDFEGTTANPTLNYGVGPNTNLSTALVLQGDGSYTATLTGLTDPQALVYQIAWDDTDGNSFTSAVVPFEADSGHAGIRSTANFAGPSRMDVATRVQTPIASQFVDEATGVPVLEMEWRVDGSSGAYYKSAALGTPSFGGDYFDFNFVATNGVAGGSYEVVVFGLLASGDRFVLDTFVVTLNDANVVHEAMTWALPQADSLIGANQLIILNGERADGVATRREGHLLLDLDDTGPAARTYDVFYGNLTGNNHAVSATQYYVTTAIADVNASDNFDPILNPTGVDMDADFDWQVTSYELQVDASGTPAGTQVAWRQAGTGSEFTNVANVGDRFTIPTPGNAAREFDIKVFYIDGNGNEVIVDWTRVTTIAGPAVGTIFIEDPAASEKDENILSEVSESITVLASETGATVTRNANGTMGLDPGLYIGALIAEDRYQSFSLNFAAPVNDPGTIDFSPGTTEGYFVDNRFNAIGNRIATNEGDGVWREYGLDAKGNIVATFRFGTEANATAWHATMAAASTPIVTFSEFDAKDREIRTWSAAAAIHGVAGTHRGIQTTDYDFAGQIVSRTDAAGFTTSTEFDALGRETSTTNKLGDTTFIRYDRLGNRLAEIDPNGNMTVWTYDGTDRMSSRSDALGNTTTFGLDAFGRRVSETQEGVGATPDRVRTIEYDQRDRVVRTVEAPGGLNLIDRFSYDGRNNRLETIDANGHFWRQVYDSLGRVVETISFQNNQMLRETRTYDVFGNLTLTTDAEGRSRSNTYGAFSTLIYSDDESGRRTSYGYDRFGRQTSETRASSGKNILRSYDDAGRLTQVNDVGTGISTVYTYDINGKRKSETSSTAPSVLATLAGVHNRAITYNYDALGQVVRWADSVTNTQLNYQYDAAGNLRHSFNDNLSVNHVYNFDIANRVTSINRNGTVLTYGYNEFNDRISHFDGAATYNYTYDAAARVSTATWSTGTGAELQNFRINWTYDKVGNITVFQQVKVGAGNDPDVVVVRKTKLYWENNRNYFTKEASNDNETVTDKTFNFDRTGRVLTETTANTADGETKTFTYTHRYTKDGRELSVTARGDATGSSTTVHNSNDQVIIVNLGQGDDQESAGVNLFVYNNEDRIVFRSIDDGEADTEFNVTSEYLYALGKPVGDITTDETNASTTTLDTGRYNLVQDIGADHPSSSVTTIRASEGDTLQSIAASIYGNPSLWFVIAEANGLSANAVLTDGQQILVPTSVQNGTLTSANSVVYSEGDIIGSTLPNLTSPPPDSTAQCLAIFAIILVLIVAIIVTIVTFGVGSAVAGPVAGAVTGSVLGAVFGTTVAAASATAAAVAGAIGAIVAALVVGVIAAGIAFVGALITQGILIGLTPQKEINWLDIAGAVAGGFLAGVASGLGALVTAGKIIGTFAVNFTRIAQVALDVGAEVVSQLITSEPPGQIDSWASVAGAFLGSAIGVVGDSFSAIAKNADTAVEGVQAAATKAIKNSEFGDVKNVAKMLEFATEIDAQKAISVAAKKSVARVTTVQAAANIATGWVSLGEQAARGKELGPTDFIATAGVTLGIALNRAATAGNLGDKLVSKLEIDVNKVENVKLQKLAKVANVLTSGTETLFGVGFLGNTPGNNLTTGVQHLVGLFAGLGAQDFAFGVDSAGLDSADFIETVATPAAIAGPAAPPPPAPTPGLFAVTPESGAQQTGSPLNGLVPGVGTPGTVNGLPSGFSSPGPSPAAVGTLASAINSGNIGTQTAIITQANNAAPTGAQTTNGVTANNGSSVRPLSNTNGLQHSTLAQAAGQNNSSMSNAIRTAQQAVAGVGPVTTPSDAGAPQAGLGLNGSGNVPLAQVDPVTFSNAMISQAETTSSIAAHVGTIATTGNGMRSNDVFGDPGAATRNDRVLGSLGVNGKVGVPQPLRNPDDAQTRPLATPGVRSTVNPYNAVAPTSTAAAFGLGAVSSAAAAAALGFASGVSSSQQYAGELSQVASDNRVANGESAGGISLLAAAAGSGVFAPAANVAASSRTLMLGTVVSWSAGAVSNSNPARGFDDRFNHLVGATASI